MRRLFELITGYIFQLQRSFVYDNPTLCKMPRHVFPSECTEVFPPMTRFMEQGLEEVVPHP